MYGMVFFKVAWNIFTNGKQTLGLNLSERFSITDNALIDMKVPWLNNIFLFYFLAEQFHQKLCFCQLTLLSGPTWM